MLRELLSILRSDKPLAPIGRDFAEMIGLTKEMISTAGDIYFGIRTSPEDRTRIYEQDLRVNKLERSIRKRVVSHLSLPGNTADVPYCLAMMSLIKDVERLGDYAKNLSEVIELSFGDLPDDEITQELREIRHQVDEAYEAAINIFESSDQGQALYFIRKGRDMAHRCDALILRIAKTDYTAEFTTAAILGARYYKRIGGHVLNVLSSVVMPLHKIDYYDEDAILASDVPKEPGQEPD